MSGNINASRARVAGLKRRRDPQDPAVLAAERDLRAAKLEAYVARVVAEAPPLTIEQVDRITVALRTPYRAAAGGGAA